MPIVRLKAHDGSVVEFVDNMIGQGGVKDVFFSPDKSYVVAFFRAKPDFNDKDRLLNIVGKYRESIFDQPGGDYWKDLYCWPTKVVEHNGKIGVVCPTYQNHYFFKVGSVNNDILNIKGKEKDGKWFASAKNMNKYLAPVEKGDWLKYFQIAIKISRAVKRLHSAGLAHSDLSYKNVLIDPTSGKATIIDIDGLVVPGRFPPDVIGTPDFIAPEVIQTKNLPIANKARKLPSIATDRHALSVMIYMYLLHRHPLKGGKINDQDPSKDIELSMGIKALFIENPKDSGNRVRNEQLDFFELPQGDPLKIPYSVCGPHLKELFNRALIDGLHNPALRPTADEWEGALLKTVDLMQPCNNPKCWHKWFVFDNTGHPKCPFCGTVYNAELPVLNLYYSPKPGSFMYEERRLMVYDKQSLYMWHVNRFISPNEKTTPQNRVPVGDFHFLNGKWILINRKLPQLFDKDMNKKIEIGEAVDLSDGKKILLSTEDGGRLIVVQLVNPSAASLQKKKSPRSLPDSQTLRKPQSKADSGIQVVSTRKAQVSVTIVDQGLTKKRAPKPEVKVVAVKSGKRKSSGVQKPTAIKQQVLLTKTAGSTEEKAKRIKQLKALATNPANLPEDLLSEVKKKSTGKVKKKTQVALSKPGNASERKSLERTQSKGVATNKITYSAKPKQQDKSGKRK